MNKNTCRCLDTICSSECSILLNIDFNFVGIRSLDDLFVGNDILEFNYNLFKEKKRRVRAVKEQNLVSNKSLKLKNKNALEIQLFIVFSRMFAVICHERNHKYTAH